MLQTMRPGTIGGQRTVLLRLRDDERGVALLVAIGVLAVMTIVLSTVLFLTAAGARESQRTNAGQRAHSLAEAGINDAVSVLNANYPGTVKYPGDYTLLSACPGSYPTICSRTTTYSSGTVSWSGWLQTPASTPPLPAGVGWGAQWNITATGTVTNPTSGATSVSRTVTVVVPVVIPIQAPIGNNNPLNFIYSKGNITFQQSVTVASPVYATQNLELQNSSTICEFIGCPANPSGAAPNVMAVGGNFLEDQNANKAGHIQGTTDPTYDLGQAYIVGQCKTKAYDNFQNLHTCQWGSGDQVWAVTNGNTIPANFLSFQPALTCCAPFNDIAALAPSQSCAQPGCWSNMGSAYISADFSPRQPCASGSVPFSFGNDSAVNKINNNATPAGSSPIDLTPTSSYSCKSADGLKEISWDNGTKTLRVQGEVFIDGSATISSGPSAKAKVTGQGIIFLTGTFSMKNALMCVNITGSSPNFHCDTTPGLWDPNVGALVIVADGDGGYDSTQAQGNNVSPGDGIDLKGSEFQGGLIANKNINVDTTSKMQGPMISVYHDVNAGQSNILTFPPILFAPGGGGNLGPTPVPQLLSPRQFGGG
jgi:hypothetical protein